MLTCDCPSFADLDLTRDAINQRARENKSLKARLEPVAKHPDGEHRLLSCSQQWESSLAWNWGNKEYLFRVPSIVAKAWIEEPFVQPDELLIFAASLSQFLKQQSLEATNQRCRQSGCEQSTVKLSPFCLIHHIENLQTVGLFPKSPTGRWFPPYEESSFAIPTRNLDG